MHIRFSSLIWSSMSFMCIWAIECTRLFLKMHCCVWTTCPEKKKPMCRRYLHNLSYSRMYICECAVCTTVTDAQKNRFAVQTLCHDKWLEFFNQMWTSYCKISHLKFQFKTKKNSHVCVCVLHVCSSSEQISHLFKIILRTAKFICNCLSESRKKIYCICWKS